jgi:hypothetical protein
MLANPLSCGDGKSAELPVKGAGNTDALALLD